MSRNNDIFDEDIELIDIDLEDIEDRSDEYDISISIPDEELADEGDLLPNIADASDIEKELINDVKPADISTVVKPQTVEEHNSPSEEKKTQKKKKQSGVDMIRSFLMVIAVCILIYAGYQLTMIFMEYKEASDEYKEIEDFTSSETVTYNADYDLGDPFNPNFVPTQVDWQSLVSVNSEIYAWIEFENKDIGINYPIAKGVDNEYYLGHTVNGTENSSGSIYIDKDNDPYFHDTNTFIYGHNMKNGSMFGHLRYYKDAAYYGGNEYFWIYTPDSRCRYKIFSCYEPAVNSDAYRWWPEYCDEYTQYLMTAKANSLYDTGVNVEGNDKIVTLSTCTSRGDDYRFIVQAKLIYREFK